MCDGLQVQSMKMLSCGDAEGLLHVVDRIKDMIVTGGENVFSAEVENALAQHAAVQSCAVIGVPDPDWGEKVHAVVVLRSGASMTADGLIAHCRERIAGYKCPRSVEFRQELPLSAAGKLQKFQLRAPHWEGRSRQIGGTAAVGAPWPPDQSLLEDDRRKRRFAIAAGPVPFLLTGGTNQASFIPR